MYAVTGIPREYEEQHPESSSDVTLYLIEECSMDDNSIGGWRLYWYADGSEGGVILAQMWGYLGMFTIPVPLEGEPEDIFDEDEIQTLLAQEETVVPAPWGVRYRLVSPVEFADIKWTDLGHKCMTLGRIDRWQTWLDKLSA